MRSKSSRPRLAAATVAVAPTVATPERTAREAGLRYMTDAAPGIRRVGRDADGTFRYLQPDGGEVVDPETLRRIKALGIPPAWVDVWISPLANSHLQATGRDARGRKQYRYHQQWRAARDETKFGRMLNFGHALPGIRAHVARDLSRPGMPREKVLAAVIALLDLTHIRVGNEEYARENETFGLTTMRSEHVSIRGTTIRFRFRGKAGKEHLISISDRRLARIIKHCQELPGQELFQYADEHGQVHCINSDDVNDYLRAISGLDFTAKDFRTWAGTHVAACALRESGPFETEGQAKRRIVEAIRAAATHLGNTPAICRKCYVHPGVLGAYLTGWIHDPGMVQGVAEAPPAMSLKQDEFWTLSLLRRLFETGERLSGAA
jgi:DNA topoisomerase-1